MQFRLLTTNILLVANEQNIPSDKSDVTNPEPEM